MNQCSILYVTTASDAPHIPALRSLGFHVDHSDDLPPNEAFAAYHAVIIRPAPDSNLAMLATRLRAKPHFGRRVLLALLHDAVADRRKREAIHSGFDYTLPETCGARDLAASVLRLLRPYPEYRCLLRAPGGRRRAA